MQLDAQFNVLIRKPLDSSVKNVHVGPIVIIFDALDECGTSKRNAKYDRGPLLKLLANTITQLPPSFRVIITSRSVPDIERVLSKIEGIHIEELKVSPDSQDISIFIRDRLDQIADNNRVPEGWPEDSKVKTLVERAEGLFIWAELACNMIDGWRPIKQLDSLVDGSETISLDDLYLRALESSCDRDWNKQGFKENYRDVLGVILAAKAPLSPSTIDRLLGSSGSIDIISFLSSVLYHKQDEPTKILHESFREYLSDQSKCGAKWFINIGDYTRILAQQCIEMLEITFEYFHQLTLSSPCQSQVLTEAETYACLYWVSHVCEMEACSGEFGRRLFDWLAKHLLHWLQAMSILERSRGTASSLKQLLIWVEVSLLCQFGKL